MEITLSQIVTWCLIGILVGSVTGVVITRQRSGFGRFANFGVGLVGALIGGGLFHLFKIDLGLGGIAISAEDLVAAFAGSLLFLLAVWLFRRSRS